jgi:CheY-like chemotaxis protein
VFRKEGKSTMGQDTLKAEAETAPEMEPGPDACKVAVLLVEDEELIAEIIGEALSDHGFAVHILPTADAALAHLQSGARFDVLFTDINLPGELDGAQLAIAARQLDPALAVIYASGRWGLLDKLRKQPQSAILQKPYSPARACETVQVMAALRADKHDRAQLPSDGLAMAL